MKRVDFPATTSDFGEYPGVVVSGEKLYVLGGENKRNAHSTELTINKSTQCFSFKSQTWDNCAPMLNAVSDMGVR